jgi:hypothetical protein
MEDYQRLQGLSAREAQNPLHIGLIRLNLLYSSCLPCLGRGVAPEMGRSHYRAPQDRIKRA